MATVVCQNLLGHLAFEGLWHFSTFILHRRMGCLIKHIGFAGRLNLLLVFAFDKTFKVFYLVV